MVQRQIAEGLTYRNELRAGLTGPAQVTKGSGLRFADLDLRYVEKLRRLRGLALVRYDLGILWATVRVILRREGLSY
jgi:lipopolysaccharide/colanic/teichoic acid biosynthesis glycosyltransferase